MILPNQIPNELFRAQDPDGDTITTGVVTTPSGDPGVYLGVFHPDEEVINAVILTPDEAVELAVALGKALYGLPE